MRILERLAILSAMALCVLAGEPLVVAGCAANGIVFVGNFSGKPVTVGVESVAADKARVLLANGAVSFGASFRLAPWGFAFLEEK